MSSKITIKAIKEITVELHQHRDHKTMAVRFETAEVKRVIEYVERGKTYKTEYSVDVVDRGELGELPDSYEVNWSAVGSVPAEFATAYAELLTEAVRVAGRLTEAYVKKA